MNMRLTSEEIIGFYFIKDVDLGLIGRSMLNERFGKEGAELIYRACKNKNKEEAFKQLDEALDIGPCDNSEFVDAVEYARDHIESPIKRLGETTLFKMVKSENNALSMKGKEYFCIYNKNYVYQMIHRNYDSYVKDSLEFDDFVQEAMAEMLKALDSFDPEKGKFITFSKLFVKHGLENQVHFADFNSTTHFTEKNKAVKKAINQLNVKGIANPSVFQIAKLSGLSPSEVKEEMDYIKRTSSLVYIDAETDDQNFLEKFDPLSMTPDEAFMAKERTNAIYKAIEELPDNIKEIFLYKYIDGMKNSDIAQKCGCTLVDVKEACNSAMKRLRRSEHIKSIATFRDKAAIMMDEYSIPLVKGHKSKSNNTAKIEPSVPVESDLDDILDMMAAM